MNSWTRSERWDHVLKDRRRKTYEVKCCELGKTAMGYSTTFDFLDSERPCWNIILQIGFHIQGQLSTRQAPSSCPTFGSRCSKTPQLMYSWSSGGLGEAFQRCILYSRAKVSTCPVSSYTTAGTRILNKTWSY